MRWCVTHAAPRCVFLVSSALRFAENFAPLLVSEKLGVLDGARGVASLAGNVHFVWRLVIVVNIRAGKPVYRRARELDQLRTMSSKKNPGTLPAEAATEK